MDIIERLQTELLDFYYQKLSELNEKKTLAFQDLMTREITEEEKEEISLAIEEEMQQLYKKIHAMEKQGKIFTPEDFYIESQKATARILNKKIDEQNRKIKEEKNTYKREIEKIKKIIELLQKEVIDPMEVYQLLRETTLSNSIKADYMKDISVYAEIKNKEYVEKLKKKNEEKERLEQERKKAEELKKLNEKPKEETKINNSEYIEAIIEKYGDLFPQSISEMNFEEIFNDTDLKQLLDSYFIDIDDDVFNCVMGTLLSKLIKATEKDKIDEILKDIDKLCKKCELLSKLNDLENLIKDIYARFNVTGDEVILLSKIQNEIAKVKNNNFDENKVGEVIDETYTKIYEIRKQKYIKFINSDDKLTIKSFVLFDYQKTKSKKTVPYVLYDLDEKNSENYIDESINKEKIVSNGYNDFNDLIDELLIYGAPQITLQKNDKLNKLIRPIYYHDSVYDNIKSSMKNATGMFRIRPRLTSYVRFIDEKVVFAPKTEKMKQIKELLESRLPNIRIDENRSFILFINYLDAFKLKDTDSYTTSQKRREISELRRILHNNNDKFTDEELYKIGKAIDMTLEAYQALKNMNGNFNFNTVDKLQNNDQIISLD